MFEGRSEQRADFFLATLREAACQVGFSYLVRHGIDAGLVQDAREAARDFFAQSVAGSLAIEMVNSAHFRGYTRAGGERTRGRRDWCEQLDIGAERPAVSLGLGMPPWARLRGSNQWPVARPELPTLLLRRIHETTRVAIRLLKAAA